MILHFQIDLKGYMENISNNYIDFDYICPKCGAKHTWRRHGFYERHILYLEDHYLHDHSLKVLRLQCTSCNSTHAILPNNTIPYSIYCLSAFLQITSEVLIHNHSSTTNMVALMHLFLSHVAIAGDQECLMI